MNTDGLTIKQAATALGISDRTLRRGVWKYRGLVGPVREGVIHIRGRCVAFRQVFGVRNDEYRFWLDEDVVPGSIPDLPDPIGSILTRLDAVEAGVTEIRAWIHRTEEASGR